MPENTRPSRQKSRIARMPVAVWLMLPLALYLLVAAIRWTVQPAPAPANPALWEVTAPGDGPKAGKAWLFGTIHALPHAVAWQTPAVAAAMNNASEVMVEIANIDDAKAIRHVFAEMAHGASLPPLAERLPEHDRPALAALLAKAGIASDALDGDRTWAAALALSAAGTDQAQPENGVDRAVIAQTHLPIVELEGAAAQFAAFDALPEASQRVLLDQAVSDTGHGGEDLATLANAWARGDMAAIAQDADGGLLADPGLREGLYTARNRRWAARIADEIAAGHRPFVAVGAAHMAGAQGLPAMLAVRGFSVRRVE